MRFRKVPVIPRIVGIYALYKKSKIVYIGQSVNLLMRLSAHSKSKYDQAKFISCKIDELNDLETRLIAKYKPCLNKQVIGYANRKVNHALQGNKQGE